MVCVVFGKILLRVVQVGGAEELAGHRAREPISPCRVSFLVPNAKTHLEAASF